MAIEAEIKFKILQALDLSGGQLTKGMLTAHLTSRVRNTVRDIVIKDMIREGTIELVNIEMDSYRAIPMRYEVIRLTKAFKEKMAQTNKAGKTSMAGAARKAGIIDPLGVD